LSRLLRENHMNLPDRPADEDRAIWRLGVREGMPTLFGIGAWGLVVGVAMVKSGLTVPQALGMTCWCSPVRPSWPRCR
jgi:predicted branched-subunit amino acid permease